MARFVHLGGDTEDTVLSGSELMHTGVSLTPSYGGTGYEDGTRIYSDYASRMYFMEREAGENRV